MIRTLTGANSSALTTAVQQYQAAFVAEYTDMGLERVDGQEVDVQRIHEALTSLPFLASRKLVVLRAPSGNKQFLEKYEALLEGVPDTTDVILYEPKLDKRLAYYKYLKKHTEFTEFAALDANGLARWLVDASEGSLSSTDARYLVERVGTDQQLLSNELEKLRLHSPKITRHTIDLLTDQTPQSTIFELLDAAFRGNHRRAAALYAEQRALKVEPQQILAMLAWQLHVLAIIKTAGNRSAEGIAKDAKLSPYVVKKSQGVAHNLSMREVTGLVSDLLSIDMQSKRTMLDLDDALQHFLLKLG